MRNIFHWLFLIFEWRAHLKNFFLLEPPSGDYLLSPASDLINTNLHVEDTNFALKKGLFADDFKSDYYKKNGHPSKGYFIEFARRIGLVER